MKDTILKKEKRFLPCELTESEKVERGATLARELVALNQAQDAEAERRKAEKIELEKREAEIRMLSVIVASGRETREVEVEIFADHDAGQVYTMRTDTGEILSRRDIRPEERQISLLGAQGEDSVPAAQ